MSTSILEVPAEIIRADKVETGLGALEFRDGMPSADTVSKVYDELDYLRAVDTFLNAYSGVSQYAIRKGFLDSGIKDNDVLLFSGFDGC